MEVSAIIPEILLPANYVTILSLVFRTDRIEILAESRQVAPQCSSCGTAAQRVQSRYERQLDDLPWQGLAVRLVLRLRRFFCDQEDCPRRIFAEAIPEVAPPKARKTTRLTKVVNLIGFALGGRPGARVMSGLGLEVSRDTLLREVRRAPMLESSTPRVLGVDDWSIRRGQTYGTMIVDLEKRRRVDLLPDRKAETLASWLAARPGVEVVSRDRSAVYAEAIRKGAPQALQIADKWHLYKNAGDALECVIAGQRKTLSEVA